MITQYSCVLHWEIDVGYEERFEARSSGVKRDRRDRRDRRVLVLYSILIVNIWSG